MARAAAESAPLAVKGWNKGRIAAAPKDNVTSRMVFDSDVRSAAGGVCLCTVGEEGRDVRIGTGRRGIGGGAGGLGQEYDPAVEDGNKRAVWKPHVRVPVAGCEVEAAASPTQPTGTYNVMRAVGDVHGILHE